MNKKKNEKIEKMKNKFEKIDSVNNQVIIKHSKHIDLGDNKVKGTTISKTNKEAIDQERFEKTKLGQEFVEPEGSLEDINEIGLSLINRYMKDIFEI